MNKRQISKQTTRECIVQTAMRMFARDGISATPTATIAASAGIAHGTLFAHFATREDLIAEIITRFLRRLAVRLQKAIEDKATLGDFLTSHLDGLAENEDFYRRLLQEQSTLPPYARATILSMQSVISLQLSKVITRRSGGREQGGGCHDLLFNTWIGLVHHYILNRDLFSPGQAVCRSRRDELVDHFCLLMKNHED